MMTRATKSKLSRQARELLAQVKAEGSRGWAGAILGNPSATVDEALLFDTHPTRRRLLVDVANLRDSVALKWFWRKWLSQLRIEVPEDVLEIRDELRQLWQSCWEISQGPWQEDIPVNTERTLDKWLVWRPSLSHIAVYKKQRRFHVRQGDQPEDWVQFRCSLKAGAFVPDFSSLRAMLIQGVFEHWQHFQLCANPDCETPYFIAKRRDQTVCDSDKCKAEKQRQHALKWWRENRGKGRKNALPKKGLARHGPR
jgi:hypothetical protein